MRSSVVTDATRERCVLDLVRRERELLAQLTQLALELRQALSRADGRALEILAGRQERLLKELVMLEGQQQALKMACGEGESKGRGKGSAESEDEHPLLMACEALRAQMREFQRANAVNRHLLAGIARWTDGLFRAFGTYFEQTAPYNAHGSRPHPVSSATLLLINRQV